MEFFSQYDHKIDDKGRLVLPAAFRSAFADGGFITYMGDSVGLFTPDEFQKHRRRLELSPEIDRKALKAMHGLTSPFEPDAQHRITIPPKLLTYVGIDREIATVGQGSHAAVYPRERWESFEVDELGPDEDGDTLADKIERLPFL